MPKPTISGREILAAALVGLHKQRADVKEKIAGIRGGSRAAGGQARLSGAAWRRIIAAQRKSGAAFRGARCQVAAV